MPRLLNFGCGNAFHPDWVNLDGLPSSPEIGMHDLSKRFPFDEGSFDAVYGSHVLEHFDPASASRLLEDCHRILRPGGVIRIVVPDLETIARLYLECLDGALARHPEDEGRYEWVLLELYDQVTRNTPGGRMQHFLDRKPAGDVGRFVASRIGAEGSVSHAPSFAPPSVAWRAMRRAGLEVNRFREAVVRGFAFLVLGRRGSDAVREGFFRQSGEIHQWMYDRYSLSRLLERAGFSGVRRCRAGESGIEGFAGHALEVVGGRERKPDSLYMEASKAG